MNETIKNILERRSIRKYKSDPVPSEYEKVIIDAGLYAPNSRGTQARHICVITNPDTIESINVAVKKYSQAPGFDKYKPKVSQDSYSIVFQNAPMFVILSGDTDPAQTSSNMADCGLVLGNMFNAAWALGIGSCWINQLVPLSAEPNFRTLVNSLGIPEKYEICGAACFGYPDGNTPVPVPRRDGTLSKN
jgi:nitroreductase